MSFKCPLGEQKCCFKRRSRGSWEEPRDGRSRKKHSGRCFLHQAEAVPTTTRESASCFEGQRKDTLTEMSCLATHVIFWKSQSIWLHQRPQEEDSTWLSCFLWNCGVAGRKVRVYSKTRKIEKHKEGLGTITHVSPLFHSTFS